MHETCLLYEEEAGGGGGGGVNPEYVALAPTPAPSSILLNKAKAGQYIDFYFSRMFNNKLWTKGS